MPFMTWSEEDTVSVESIDDQHKAIVDLVNDLHMNLGSDKEFYTKHLIGELVKKVREHFDTEENFMRDYKFPNYISHKLEHDRFFNKIQDFNSQLENGNEDVNLELLRSIKRWFYNHLEINDRKIAAYLREQGVN